MPASRSISSSTSPSSCAPPDAPRTRRHRPDGRVRRPGRQSARGSNRVGGTDPDEAAAQGALERGAVDEVAPLGSCLRRPTSRWSPRRSPCCQRSSRRCSPARRRRCTVTDVGSTKDWSLRFPERFVGGHPVCGREARGPAHATADLFDGATWFLTPTAGTDPERYRVVHGFVASLGAVPVAIDPACARPPRGADEPPPACARQPARQPGGRRADRGPRPARRRWRLAPRHDPRRRREPADLGGHLSRQRPRVGRGARRAPPPRRAARGGARPRATGARWPAGSPRRPRTAAGCSPRRTPTRASSSG